MSRRGALFGALSFLDLICCSLGAAVLMLIIAVTADPANRPRAPRRPLIVVCHFAGGARAEVAIEFRRPNHASWERGSSPTPRDTVLPSETTANPQFVRTSAVTAFAASSEANSGSYAVVLITDPVPGRWEFRPLLIDFPKDMTDEPVIVRMEILSRNLDAPPDSANDTLRFIGDTGQTIPAFVSNSLTEDSPNGPN